MRPFFSIFFAAEGKRTGTKILDWFISGTFGKPPAFLRRQSFRFLQKVPFSHLSSDIKCAWELPPGVYFQPSFTITQDFYSIYELYLSASWIDFLQQNNQRSLYRTT